MWPERARTDLEGSDDAEEWPARSRCAIKGTGRAIGLRQPPHNTLAISGLDGGPRRPVFDAQVEVSAGPHGVESLEVRGVLPKGPMTSGFLLAGLACWIQLPAFAGNPSRRGQ